MIQTLIQNHYYKHSILYHFEQKMHFVQLILLFITALGYSEATIATNPPHQQQASLTCAATCPDTPAHDSTDQHPSNIGTDMIKRLINETKANTKAIDHLKKDFCDLKGRFETTAVILNNVLSLAEEIVGLLNDTATPATLLTTSCQEVKQKMPSSPSGEYQIFNADNQTQQYVYCNMETLCGSDEGWTRLAHINMTDPEENCPGGLRLYVDYSKRACGRPTSGSASCHSIKYPSHGIEYSRVCGKVIGQQFGGPGPAVGTGNINTHYVDGVSLTRGSPRQHIWTFMGAPTENFNGNSCPCASGQSHMHNIPSFIGNDYYCESGQTGGWTRKFYTADPLWDGENCGHLEAPCCAAADLPWFNKQLGTTTIDYIEVRVCGDGSTGVADTPIEQLEIYIQ